jgi:peptidoglycan/LPS O-acetylase OafA/YrhL
VTREPIAVPYSARHFPAADGIRGVAILMVVLHNSEFVERSSTSALLKLTGAITATGWIGVQLFFVLSGFLITGILADARGSAGYFRNFYIRRVLRIFPLYYAVLFLAIVVFPLVANVSDWTAVAKTNQWWYWGYLSNWGDVFHHSIEGFTHFWSLAVEEQFYLAWPVLVFALSRRNVMRLCAFLIVSAPAIRFGLHLVGLAQQGAYELTIARWDALAAGALLAMLMRDAELRPALERWIKAAALLSLGATLPLLLYERGFHPDDLWVQVAGQTLIAILSTALVYYCVAEPAGIAARVQRVMGADWLRFFGKYSYAMYVFHFPIQHALALYVGDSLNAGDGTVRFLKLMAYLACIIALSTVAAMVSWRVLEQPFLALKDRWAPRKYPNVSQLTSRA